MRPQNISPAIIALATVLIATAASSSLALASPNGPAETGLDDCQNTLRTEGVKYVQATQKAIATCLGKVSTEVLKKNAPSVAAAVSTCAAQFGKLGRIRQVFNVKVSSKCYPSPARHTLSDLLGTGSPGVAEPLNVETNLSRICSQYAFVFGAVDSADEWLSCMRGAQDCSVRHALTTEFPRVLEWLDALATAMPPSIAHGEVTALEAAIDGASNDGVPNLQCGSTCGDGVKIATEQCDGADLAGANCESLGYAAGTLGCGSTCSYDTSACTGGFLATGQTTCWGGNVNAPVPIPCAGTGQDGDTQRGTPLSFVDNGDGTISDRNTGLMWEKKSDDGTLHDKDLSFPWAGLCSGDGVTLCGRDGDCAGAGGVCQNADGQTASPNGITIFEWVDQLNTANYAGHGDWRIPNRRELENLIDYGQVFPSVSAGFNTNCGANSSGNAGCTVTTCSCTHGAYWSSTTHPGTPRNAWIIYSNDGNTLEYGKTMPVWVRAVRGGS